jgi:hypothetical protein
MENLGRKMAVMRKNFGVYFGICFQWLMKVLYFGGIPLSFMYGKFPLPFPKPLFSLIILIFLMNIGMSTKPPILLYAWYTVTGNTQMLQEMGMGGPMM